MKVLGNLLLTLSLVYGMGYIDLNKQVSSISLAQAADCVANNNLSESADAYISRCRKASIRNEFPGEMYSLTLGEIKSGSSANHKKAWKLLNDNRFAK